MFRLKIKPLSVNQCWQGKRFKTKAYDFYENEVFYSLPKDLLIPKNQKLCFNIKVGFSCKSADLDNILKPIQDILQKKYNFNDKAIYKIIAEKEDVAKGGEYFEFSVEAIYTPS